MPDNDEINILFLKYERKIREKINDEDLKRQGLVDDVVNEVYFIFRKKYKTLKNKKAISSNLKYWILEARKNFFKKHKCEVKLKDPRYIEQFYEKVQSLIKKGYHEKEAKKIVIFEQSILDHRIVLPVNVGSTHNVDSSTEDEKGDSRPFYDIISETIQEDINNQDDRLVEAEKKNFFEKAQAFCFEKWRNRKGKNAERDYHILRKFYYQGIKQTRIAEENELTPPRIKEITDKGMEFITKCIRNQLLRVLDEVPA